MEKLIISQEIIQITWGIELFLKFLLFLSARGIIDQKILNQKIQELESLRRTCEKENDPTDTSNQLNRSIDLVNQEIKKNTEPNKYAPFPYFTFVFPGEERSAVMEQIDMVERTLTEAAEAGVIDWEKESDYFKEILNLFSNLEENKVRPVEALAKLLSEIEKFNKLTDEKSKLPLIDLSAYE